jgi:prephenate dehydrogenase
MMKKVCIIGIGLIGGSLAKAIKKTHQSEIVFGYGRDEERLERAQKGNLIDQYSLDMGEALDGANMVIIATPVGSYESILKEMKPHISKDMVISDVGSTKVSVIEAVKSVFDGVLDNFIPAHPIAGKEKSGFEVSDADLFVNKKVIITPLENNNPESIKILTKMWEEIGAEVDFMTPQSHDDLLGMTSHLPHMLAFSLVNYLVSQHPEASVYAAGGFKDFSRIASGDAIMWRDICLHNRDAIIAHIKGYQESLNTLADAINSQNKDQLESLFREAKNTRDSWID